MIRSKYKMLSPFLKWAQYIYVRQVTTQHPIAISSYFNTAISFNISAFAQSVGLLYIR